MARHNAKGRNKGMGRFLALPHAVMDSEAWKATTAPQRSCLLEIARLYNGTNNGRLAMSHRRLGELAKMNKDTAGRCLKALEAKGFIEQVVEAAYDPRDRGDGGLQKAPEYRLTWCRCDRSNQMPSRAYRDWKPPQNPEACPLVPDNVSPSSGQSAVETVISVPSFRTERAA